MTLTPILVEAPTIASAWCKIIQAINTLGEVHNPDYGTPTKRVHLTVKISDVHNRQVSELLPFGSKSIEKYKEELTEEYADYYLALKDDDPAKFVYCYAKQLYNYGQNNFNTLRENIRNLRPGSRRHVGVLWENEIHIPQYEDQPCWIAYKLEVINEHEVRLFILYRSWDAFGGLPANLPAIVYGVEKVLDEGGTGYKIGELIATGWDAHIYDSDMQTVENILKTSDWCRRCQELHKKQLMVMRDKGNICERCLK